MVFSQFKGKFLKNIFVTKLELKNIFVTKLENPFRKCYPYNTHTFLLSEFKQFSYFDCMCKFQAMAS